MRMRSETTDQEIDWRALWNALDDETKERQRALRKQTMQLFRNEPLLTEDGTVAYLKLPTAETLHDLTAPSYLIALPYPQGRLYPAFQFDENTIRPVAAQVNRLLVAGRNPWAAMSWWHRRHGRIGKKPVELIGTYRENDIIELAAADISFDS